MDVTCLKQYSIYLMHKQRNFLHHSTRKVKFSETGVKAMCEHFCSCAHNFIFPW